MNAFMTHGSHPQRPKTLRLHVVKLTALPHPLSSPHERGGLYLWPASARTNQLSAILHLYFPVAFKNENESLRRPKKCLLSFGCKRQLYKSQTIRAISSTLRLCLNAPPGLCGWCDVPVNYSSGAPGAIVQGSITKVDRTQHGLAI